MFYDKKVGIHNKTEGTKVNGVYIPGKLQWVKDIYVDIQPYSTALLLKDYGYNIEVTKRIFSDIEANIKIGTILKYNLDEYEVRKIIPWDDYMEVMCYGV
ncbi:hypothetical protein HMPREF1982_03552 [Clostridiales bacterium oral taxon 876 str. F0540]|nr:hypothetical protein HMPREF1982_03552 [Clostridiales bacterium oral taxon 876 str. F0540]